MSRQGSALILLLILFELRTACFSQQNCIYRVIASKCLQQPAERTQTGFIMNGTRGIFTALHGVVDAKEIRAVSRAANEAFNSLKISEVDIEHDVALLDSSELDGKNLPGLDRVEFSEIVDPGPLKVLGYPLGIELIPTLGLLLRSPNLVELRTLLEIAAEKPVKDRGSPFYKAKMLSIQGKFLPGHSGAPVLDLNNRVIAIANGGLRGGLADISWAVPMNSLEMDPKADEEDLLYKLQNLKPDAVFMFTPQSIVWTPPTDASSVSRRALPVYGDFPMNMRSIDDANMVLTKIILSKNATVAEFEYHNDDSKDTYPTFYGPGSEYAFRIVDINDDTVSKLQQVEGVEHLNDPIVVSADGRRHIIARFAPISPTVNRFHILEGAPGTKRWIFKDITLLEEPTAPQSPTQHSKSTDWDIASFKLTVKHMLATVSDGFSSGREEFSANNSDTKTRIYRGKWLPNGAHRAWCQEEEIFTSDSIKYKYSYYIVYEDQTEEHAKELFNLAKDALDDILPERFRPQPPAERYTFEWKNSESTPTHSFSLNQQPSERPGLYDIIIDAVRETSDRRRW